MLVEVAGKELSFQAVSRTGQTVDKGTILMRDDAVPLTAIVGSRGFSPYDLLRRNASESGLQP
jgi:hypothetical protein